ncbi:MAG: hypothetical protein AB2L24_13170 [Mangrovibacterium sp.]
MNKFYISKNYSTLYTASAKAKTDCEIIIRKNGYRDLGLGQRTMNNLFWGRIHTVFSIFTGLIRLPDRAVLFLQYPNNLYQTVVRIAKMKHARIITLIHDLTSLRGVSNEEEVLLIGQSDVLIAHNPAMIGFLQSKNVKSKFVSLEIFDYLYKDPILQSGQAHLDHIKIVFAGNLSKSLFLSQLSGLNLKRTRFHLYGIGFDQIKNADAAKIKYEEFYPSDELVRHISGTFGLVWDGDSIDTCSGIAGNYLRYNNPHKMSLYLLCGLPVLVWSQSAQARFVTSNGLGYAIGSLHDILNIEESLTDESYSVLIRNVRQFAEKIRTGHFLSVALTQAEASLPT